MWWSIALMFGSCARQRTSMPHWHHTSMLSIKTWYEMVSDTRVWRYCGTSRQSGPLFAPISMVMINTARCDCDIKDMPAPASSISMSGFCRQPNGPSRSIKSLLLGWPARKHQPAQLCISTLSPWKWMAHCRILLSSSFLFNIHSFLAVVNGEYHWEHLSGQHCALSVGLAFAASCQVLVATFSHTICHPLHVFVTIADKLDTLSTLVMRPGPLPAPSPLASSHNWFSCHHLATAYIYKWTKIHCRCNTIIQWNSL